MSSLAIVIAATVACAPVSVTIKTFQQAAWKVKPGMLLIAQKYGNTDPHGDDPHGDDPHDEQHDDKMKANEDQKANKAPKDVYGGAVQNTKEPY